MNTAVWSLLQIKIKIKELCLIFYGRNNPPDLDENRCVWKYISITEIVSQTIYLT
jgi:hypothetical protein